MASASRDQTTTLHHRRNRKAPRIRDCTTPRHHLCRGAHSKGHAGRDDATEPVCHRRSRRASPSRPNHGTAPSTQSKGTTQPRKHNATTPPVSGVHSKGQARPRRRHGTRVPPAKTQGIAKQRHTKEHPSTNTAEEERQETTADRKAAAPPSSSGTLHRQPHEPLVTTHKFPRRRLQGGSGVHDAVVARSSSTRS